jgi:hypothetical protein
MNVVSEMAQASFKISGPAPFLPYPCHRSHSGNEISIMDARHHKVVLAFLPQLSVQSTGNTERHFSLFGSEFCQLGAETSHPAFR